MLETFHFKPWYEIVSCEEEAFGAEKAFRAEEFGAEAFREEADKTY